MSNAWLTTAGAGIIDGNGALVLCDICPCSSEAACFDQCKAAIRERQSACNITPWTDAQFLLDNVADLGKGKMAVNALAGYFSQPYSGGLYPPITYSGSYGNSAANWCELYELLKVLMRTRRNATNTTSECYRLRTVQKFGQNNDVQPTLDQAAAIAIAQELNSQVEMLSGYWRTQHLYNGYVAQQYHGAGRIRLRAMTALLTKTAQTYAIFLLPPYGANRIFYNQGWYEITAPDLYIQISSNGFGSDTEGLTDEMGFRTPAPTYNDPGDIGGDVTVGMQGYVTFVILTWGFAHHP